MKAVCSPTRGTSRRAPSTTPRSRRRSGTTVTSRKRVSISPLPRRRDGALPGCASAPLKGSAAVGVQIYVSLVANWEKRGGGAAIAALDPENLDVGQVFELLIENDPTLARYSAEELIHTRGRMTRVRDDFEAAADVGDEPLMLMAIGIDPEWEIER